jgi:hypothetical protein
MTVPAKICYFLMREYISLHGAYHTPDGHMIQLSALCDYIQQG